MSEMPKASSLQGKAANHAFQPTKHPWILGLLSATLIWSLSVRAEAEPSGTPTANQIFFNCTFTTDSLNDALAIGQSNLNKLSSRQIEASYIIIYTRQYGNDGQPLATATPSFTGPVVCVNSGLDNFTDITPTTAGSAILGPVDIVGAEEGSHLQYRPPGGAVSNTEKRVCHTVASNTECFLIQP
jgi:hypothetical protein